MWVKTKYANYVNMDGVDFVEVTGFGQIVVQKGMKDRFYLGVYEDLDVAQRKADNLIKVLTNKTRPNIVDIENL